MLWPFGRQVAVEEYKKGLFWAKWKIIKCWLFGFILTYSLPAILSVCLSIISLLPAIWQKFFDYVIQHVLKAYKPHEDRRLATVFELMCSVATNIRQDFINRLPEKCYDLTNDSFFSFLSFFFYSLSHFICFPLEFVLFCKIFGNRKTIWKTWMCWKLFWYRNSIHVFW